jgi:hypothetical protein
MQSNLQGSVFGLLAALLFVLLPPAAAWADQHQESQGKVHERQQLESEQKGSRLGAKETKQEKVLRLAHELKNLLDRGVATFESAEPQETALQQRQRDAAQGGLVRARDAASSLVEDLDAGGDVYSSDVYFRIVDGNIQDALQTAGDFEPSLEGARILARLEEILRKLKRIYDQG